MFGWDVVEFEHKFIVMMTIEGNNKFVKFMTPNVRYKTRFTFPSVANIVYRCVLLDIYFSGQPLLTQISFLLGNENKGVELYILLDWKVLLNFIFSTMGLLVCRYMGPSDKKSMLGWPFRSVGLLLSRTIILCFLGDLSHSGDLLLWVGVRRRLSSFVRRVLTSSYQELLGQS